ncbi:MAG: hypothetical protein RR869_10520 [Lachnospiraceae bacterium]
MNHIITTGTLLKEPNRKDIDTLFFTIFDRGRGNGACFFRCKLKGEKRITYFMKELKKGQFYMVEGTLYQRKETTNQGVFSLTYVNVEEITSLSVSVDDLNMKQLDQIYSDFLFPEEVATEIHSK